MDAHLSADRSEQIRRLFDEIAELDATTRLARLAQESDPVVRREVEALLEACIGAESLHQKPDLLVTSEEASPFGDRPDRLVGQMVAHYRIEEKLGGGGMGIVYRARDTKLDRPIALKFLPPTLTRDAKAKARFIQEARAASALDHPHVGVVYEIGETREGQLLEEGQLFIAMAYYEGETLQQKIARGPLAIREALRYAMQVSGGLGRAHARGIVHRDIKPANVIVTEEGAVKIVDFGLAKMADVRLTKTGAAMGTVAYMSPEQACGKTVDHRTDLWSLGVVVYELLTAERPFRGDYEHAILYSILHEEAEPVRALRLEVPEQLEQVVHKLLQKAPEDRYQTAEEVLADLRGVSKRLRGGKYATRVANARPTGHKRTYRYAGLAVVLLVLIGLGLFVTSRRLSDTAAGSEDRARIAIAVLPLANLSDDPEQEYFSDGMTDVLISDLGMIRALKVTSRTSSMRFKNSVRPLPEIARALNVSHIVEGTILQAGGKVRIVTRLIEAETDRQLWADTHEQDLEDVLALQRTVARSIAHQIGVQLTPQQLARLAAAPTTNPEAYEAYLQGLYYWHNRPPVTPAIESFQRAIELDSTFALAHAMLAGCYAVGGDLSSRREAGRRAKEAIARALALDETTAEAYNALGWVNVYFDWDWEEAAEAFQRAIDLNPSYADAYHRYAHYLMIMGRTDEALEASRRSRELSPLDRAIVGHHVWDLYMTRQYDQAIAYSRQILDADPDNYNALVYVLPAYEQLGLYERILNIDPEQLGQVHRARALALTGREAEARQVLREMLSRSDRQNLPIAVALVYTALSEPDSAFQWLEAAYAQRSYPLADLRIDPRFDPLRSDPRFDALLEGMGFKNRR